MERVRIRDDLADLEPYGAPQLDVAVRLNTNETPYPPPAEFFAQLAKRVTRLDLNRYPDRRAWRLRTRLGERFGLPAEQVWAANGSNEVLLQLFQAYGGPDRRALLFRPGYSMHPLIARVSGTPATSADLDEGRWLTAEVAKAALDSVQPDLICFASPNNPTGIGVAADVIQHLHDRSDALVIVDEAYAEFADSDHRELLGDLARLVICRTFSKAWRLAGLRLGYLLAPGWVVDDLRKVRLPYHLDALTQEAAEVALDMPDEMTDHIQGIVAERERLDRALSTLDGVEVWPSQANFLLFRTATADLFDRLLARGVLVRDFSRQALLEGCLRVAVGTPAENDRFLEAMEESLE